MKATYDYLIVGAQTVAHGRQHPLPRGRRHPGALVRSAHLPHRQPPRVGLRELVCPLQPIYQLSPGLLRRTALQPAVQHEHLLSAVGHAHAGRGTRTDSARTGPIRPHRRAAQPRGTGPEIGRTRHLRPSSRPSSSAACPSASPSTTTISTTAIRASPKADTTSSSTPCCRASR